MLLTLTMRYFIIVYMQIGIRLISNHYLVSSTFFSAAVGYFFHRLPMTERMKFVTGDKTTQAQDSNPGPLFHTQKVRQVDTSLSHSHSTTTNSELVNGIYKYARVN